MIERTMIVYMIGTDGGLREIPLYLVDEMKSRGWRRVDNPKRTYYPEFDQTNPHYKDPDKEDVVDTNLLEVEVI